MIAHACRVDRDPRHQSEHALQVQVLEAINIGKSHPDVFAFAIPNAARRSFRLALKMKTEGLMSGAPDLCILMPAGKSVWLELKSIKGRHRIEQKGFAARCKRLDHPYALVRTIDEALVVLHQWGVLKEDFAVSCVFQRTFGDQ